MDLIEPDMDSHNGVIFLGLPTEVVHKVGGLRDQLNTKIDGVGDISSGLLSRRSCRVLRAQGAHGSAQGAHLALLLLPLFSHARHNASPTQFSRLSGLFLYWKLQSDRDGLLSAEQFFKLP